MPLAAGTRLGSYEIVAPLGAGGMGEVFRARDTRLGREVAIKGLPTAFAQHPERLARFEREARLLASLNHPAIAAIYGLEDSGGTPYLVLELVEGETLAERLARGPLTVRETLEVGGQIAAAIEAAHERGIIHRDLKPGNVMITGARAVKVLDFGLAKGGAVENASPADLSVSPTMALSSTGAGLILGTAAYMSPEQARGRTVDRGTDVWSFGCVLFECLTGRQAFAGETVSDVIARILEREPEWSSIPAAVPPRLREVVKRCLLKDAADRPRDIGDLRRELSAIAQELSSPLGARPAAGPAAPSLAVLYFENLARDPEAEYFCAGITEDILTDLSKIKGLRVASRSAVSRYRGAPVDVAKVASELGVGAVLEGSVRRAGDRLRISTQLVNAADGFQLWAERYDRTLQDVFAVQEEIASAIAEALRVALSPAEAAAVVHARPSDVRAYDLYLKGRERYGEYTEVSLREALDLFRQATEIDPDYALAWAGIADCRGQLCQWGHEADVATALKLGAEAAKRAVALGPRLPETHKADALILAAQGDDEGAMVALQRALEVDPRYTPALVNLANFMFPRADIAAAERYVRRAAEIDPQSTFTMAWVADLAALTGREDEALALLQRVLELSQTSYYLTAVYSMRTRIHLGRGDLAVAAAAVREGLAEGARPEDMRAGEAAVAAREGRLDEARRIVRELDGLAGLDLHSLALAIEASVLSGDIPLALRFLAMPQIGRDGPVLARMVPAFHPLLDQRPLAPRRLDAALVWPLEAPMIRPSVHALFREVRIESGRPPTSEVRPSTA